MLDISSIESGKDLVLKDSIVSKAVNLLSVQLGDLEYETDFGIDFKYFLESEYGIQPETFQSYLIQRMLENRINVVTVLDLIEEFSEKFTFTVGDVETSSGGIQL